MTAPAKTSPAHGSLAETLHQRLTDRTARVGVVGLGYVGLPLLVEFARGGFHAVGIDIDPRKIATINRGESYVQDVAAQDIADMAATGRLTATSDTSVIRQLDTINICVPTPLRKTRDPDLSF